MACATKKTMAYRTKARRPGAPKNSLARRRHGVEERLEGVHLGEAALERELPHPGERSHSTAGVAMQIP